MTVTLFSQYQRVRFMGIFFCCDSLLIHRPSSVHHGRIEAEAVFFATRTPRNNRVGGMCVCALCDIGGTGEGALLAHKYTERYRGVSIELRQMM